MRPYRGAIAVGLLGLLVQSVLLLPIPLLQGWVLDKLVTAGSTGELVRQHAAVAWAIVMALGGTIVLQLLRSGVSWWTAAMMGRISQEVVVAIRGALYRKLMRLPTAYFDAQQTGRLMARVTSDVGSILMFVRSGIIQLTSDLILSVAIAVALVWLQWRLAGGPGECSPLCSQPGLLLLPPSQTFRPDSHPGLGALRSAVGTGLGRAGCPVVCPRRS